MIFNSLFGILPRLILISFLGVRFMKKESRKSESFVMRIMSFSSEYLQMSESFVSDLPKSHLRELTHNQENSNVRLFCAIYEHHIEISSGNILNCMAG